MKKNLFLTCALALFAVVGVSAQNWCRTLATGLPGTEITHKVNGVDVTQYRAETALIKNAGATGVRYTVVQTTATGAYGGGPFFAMAEMIVLNANNDTISYTVTSNADHNSGGAGSDGAGIPALNDGNLNNFFHSSWGGKEPGGLHYLELTFAEPVDEFKLVWYTRPNQHVNRPQIVGLTNPGVAFTSDMVFSEYGFQLGEQVKTAAEIANGGTFTFYCEGLTDLSEYGDYVGNGNAYIALSGYTTGNATTPSPQNIVQLIPGNGGKFIIYQPVLGTYYGNPDRWTDGYNGKNGWLRAYSEAWTLGQFEITPVVGGEFEITTEITRQYVEGSWVDYDAPMTVYVGYDHRGNLKIFPEAVKEGLEQGDYTQGFGLPVDFTFKINRANVNDGVIEPITMAEMCTGVLAPVIKTANEKINAYAEFVDESAVETLQEAIATAEQAIADEDVAGAFEQRDELNAAIAAFVAEKAYYFEEVYYELEDAYYANAAEAPYDESEIGMYTEAAYAALVQIDAIITEVHENTELSYSQIETYYASIEGLVEQFHQSVVAFSLLPASFENIANTMVNNHRVYTSNIINLSKAVNGIRLTFTANNSGHMNQGYPQIVLAEFDLFDVNGNEIALTPESFATNSIQSNEGAVSNLCNGIVESGDATAGGYEYWHSIWDGSAHSPAGHVYLDITFPEAMNSFSFKFTGRKVSNGQDQQFPVSFVLTETGEAYDPVLYTENPYNVTVGKKVTSVDEITDGIYVFKGLLNTSTKWGSADGEAKFIAGTDRFHKNSQAVRAESVYRITKNEDGTYKVLNLGMAKYIPSTVENGYITPTLSESKAAKMNFIAAEGTEFENTFVMYEYNAGLTTDGDSIDTDGDEINDAIDAVYETPYVVYMDWAPRMAARPVINPQPRGGVAADVEDSKGDSLCFNKGNGEGQWEIYKVTMDNPDFYWLTGLVGVVDGLGYVLGDDPGCVSTLGNLDAYLAEAQTVIADSAFEAAPAIAKAIAGEIVIVESVERNPMVAGVYQVVSANAQFAEKQNGATKALYAYGDEEGNISFGWKDLVEGDSQFYFDFSKSLNGADLVESGAIEKDQKDLVFTIRAIATYEHEVPYYIGMADAKSTQIDLFAEAEIDYVVLNATGSAFNISLAGKHAAGFSLHTNGHSNGAGQSGNIVYWNGDAGASQWYLRKVDNFETSIGDLVVEGTEVVSVAYFTPAGAAIPAPVQGINIVVTVYANGVVETKKVLVK